MVITVGDHGSWRTEPVPDYARLRAYETRGSQPRKSDLLFLVRATGMNSNNLWQLLFKMKGAGEVRQVRRGKYAHPGVLVVEPNTPNKVDKDGYRQAKDPDAPRF